jgi:hypothetical protein
MRKTERKEFVFPVLSLSDSDVIMLVLAEWVVSQLERIVFSARTHFMFRVGSYVWNVYKREYFAETDYKVEINDKAKLHIKLGKDLKLGGFMLDDKGVGNFSFDEAVSQVEELLREISDAVVAAEAESERVKGILAEDPRFKDAFGRVFERRLEGR